jgi:hypothetical protein
VRAAIAIATTAEGRWMSLSGGETEWNPAPEGLTLEGLMVEASKMAEQFFARDGRVEQF